MAALLTLALVLPFHAHTHVELEQWYADWLAAADTVGRLGELTDMRLRHPWFFQPGKEVVTSGPANGPSVVTPPPVSTAMGSNVEQWRSLVAAYFPPDEVDRALRIMQCESGGNPNAYNPSGAAGLFQIMPFWQTVWPGDYYDPWTNAAVAYQIWLTQGYGAWVCKG